MNHADWTFSPHPIQPWPAGPEISDPNLLPTVDSLYDPTGEWKGTLVASGTVTVKVTVGDSTFHLDPEELTVEDRTGSFANTPRTWSGLVNTSALQLFYWRDHQIGGANVNMDNQSPDLDQILSGDALVDAVTGGPNAGYSYVESTTYALNRGVLLSVAFLDSASVLDSTAVVKAPLYLYNDSLQVDVTQHQLVCFEVGCAKWNAAVAGILTHEGKNGSPPGHQTRFEWILEPGTVRSE